jgi:hypothetical protein
LTATGLSATPQEYRDRLNDQPDEQIDAWVSELLRDISIYQGVLPAIAGLKKAFKTDDSSMRRIYAAGGGPAAALGKTGNGELMVPAISLYFFVPGARALVPDARGRLIDFLVANFHTIAYI